MVETCPTMFWVPDLYLNQCTLKQFDGALELFECLAKFCVYCF